SDTSRLSAMGLFEILGLSILSIKSVVVEICDPPRAVIYAAGHSALCVAGFVTLHQCVIPCSGGHVEHVLL
ncbi:hypothetical protein NPIL_448991, partial [Nephila pilipes]